MDENMTLEERKAALEHEIAGLVGPIPWLRTNNAADINMLRTGWSPHGLLDPTYRAKLENQVAKRNAEILKEEVRLPIARAELAAVQEALRAQ